MLDNLFKQNESDINVVLKDIAPLTDSNKGVVKTIRRVLHYSDEPKTFKFSAVVGDITEKVSDGRDFTASGAGYSFFSEKEAAVKCIGEAIERYCLKVYKKDGLIDGTYKTLKKKGAINPRNITSFSEKQRKNFKNADFKDNDKFYWVKGHSLISDSEVLIPAQLVYLSYKKEPEEKTIRRPISTGAAGGSCLASALNRGIYEIVERDAFMIHWLNKLTPPKVNLQELSDSRIKHIIHTFERYLLEINVLDITTDLEIPTFLSVVIDRSGIGLPVSLGLKSHLDPLEAIVGSIQETLNPREWIRGEIEDNPELVKKISDKDISTARARGIFWFDKKKIKKIDFLIKKNSRKKVSLSNARKLTDGKQLKKILEIFKNKEYEVSFVDIGLPMIKEHNYEVVFVLIPELHPLYMEEKYPYLGGERLYNVPQLIGYKDFSKKGEEMNTYPHPFL